MMRAWLMMSVSLSLLAGCRQEVEIADGFCEHFDMKSSTTTDMVMPPAKCAAAKGLPGDNLACADFTSAQVLVDLMSNGWSFTSAMSGNCAGWSVMNNSLQVTNYSALVGSCGFTMAAVPNYQNYTSFTLAVIHTPDLNKQKQYANIYLGADFDNQQILSNTGSNPRQRTLIEIDKTALPNGMSSMYQPLFKLQSSLAGGATGWAIESIAVMGNP